MVSPEGHGRLHIEKRFSAFYLLTFRFSQNLKTEKRNCNEAACTLIWIGVRNHVFYSYGFNQVLEQ